MRVAYVTSGFPVTFITSEVESHVEAGWHVLPLANAESARFANVSRVEQQWRQRTLYRPPLLRRVRGLASECIRHPLRMTQVVGWILRLMYVDIQEGLKSLYELTTACVFAQAARDFRVEHLHAHFASRALSHALILKRLLGCQVSVTVHAFDIFTRNGQSLRFRLQECAFIAAISEYNVEYLRELCGRDVARLCRIVRCGVDLRAFVSKRRNPDKGRLLCVSRLTEKKGIDVAIRACAVLSRKGVDCTLDIVGDGPLRCKLESLANELGVKQRIRFHGQLPNDQLLELLGSASAFVLPCVIATNGDRDGIPVALMEAMACHVPVISTFVSGIPELIKNGVHGVLVPERSVDELASAIECLVSDDDRLASMGVAARGRIEELFDAEVNAAYLRRLISGELS